MMIDSCSYAPFGAVVRSSYNVSSICDFLEEIACHKTFSAHFLRKSLATKLFRLISSGNRRMAYIELDVITTSDYRAEGA